MPRDLTNSKLALALRSFSPADWRKFEAFIVSPYFNTNADVIAFFQALACFQPMFEATKEEVFNRAFPGAKFDARRTGHLMNYVLKLAEQFLAVNRLQQDPFLERRLQLLEYSERKLSKPYHFLLKKARKALSDAPLSVQQLHEAYQLAEIEMIHFSNQKVRRFDPSMQAVYNELNTYYYAQLLKYACGLLSWQLVVSGDFQLSATTRQVIESITGEAGQPPLIRIYLSIYHTMSSSEEENGRHFKDLLGFLAHHQDEVAAEEMQEIYLYAINFCARKVRMGEKGYAELVLQLYEEGINRKYLLTNGYLSHWTYTNVVKLGLMQERFNWTQAFIHKYKEHLPPRFHDDAFFFNLAELEFSRRQYDKVLHALQQVSFSDPYYNLGSRMILIKTFYELKETESMLSALASFTIFLKRDKGLSNAYQQTCLNFCKLLSQILRTGANRKASELLQQVQTVQPLAERNWLLKTLQEQLSL